MFENLPVRVSFVCTETTLGSFEDLTSKEGQEYIVREGFRHYMICRAPRIIFENFDYTKKNVGIIIQRDVTKFEHKIINIQTSIKADGISTELKKIEYTKYPEIKATLSNGAEFYFATFFEFLSSVAATENDFLHLEVLYIGQTDTTDVYLRLNGHATFAKIVDRHLKSEPQSEIFIKLLKFADPVYKCANTQNKTDFSWSSRVADYVGIFPADHITSLIEATLISGCQPEFNTHYKTCFPSKKHKNYSFIYNTPIDEIEVLINENLRRYLWRLGGQVFKSLSINVKL